MSSELLASAYDVLSAPANGLLGRAGDDGGGDLPSPTAIGNLSTWYDTSDRSSMELDGSDNCQLISDKSGNSAENCLVLPGVAGNYTSFTALTAFGTGDFSVSVAVAMNTVAGGRILGGTNSSFVLSIANPGTIRSSKQSVFDNAASTGTFANLTNAVIGYTRSGTTGTYYINGIASGTITDSQDYSVGITNLGASQAGTSSPINGNIKRARVYSTALTAAQMLADSNGTIQATNTFAIDFTTYAKLAASPVTAITGQTVTINSTAIALPARIHGARDLYMGTAASQPTYLPWAGSNYGYLNGVSGNYFSTPDSAAVSITGNIDLRWFGSMTTWTPAADAVFVAKLGASGQRSYDFFAYAAGGRLRFRKSILGASLETATAAATVPFAAFEYGGVRVTHNVTTGDTVFYTSSDDGVTWDQLGSTQVIAAGAIFDSTTPVGVGAFDAATGVFAGKPYQAEIYNGIAGTLVASFAAADYITGSTLVSSATGETYTINGGAKIVTRTGLYFDGTADYMKSAAFALSQPENVYFVGEQVTWQGTNNSLYDGNVSSLGRLYQSVTSPNLSILAPSVVTFEGEALNTAQVITAVFNAASSQTRINRGTITSGNVGANNMLGFTLGARGDGGVPANIFFSESLIYDFSAQDTATQDRIALFEGQKWGINV